MKRAITASRTSSGVQLESHAVEVFELSSKEAAAAMAKGKINADKDECELVDHDANDNSSR